MGRYARSKDEVVWSMSWETAPLGKVTKIISGTTPESSNSAYWGGNHVWITPTDLGKLAKWVIEDSSRRITDAGIASCNLSLIPRQAVVMSSRAPIGHLAIAGCPIFTNQGCKSFICSDLLDPEFLFLTLRFRMPDIQALGSGATFVEVSKSALEAFEISFPELDEQRRIAARLKAQLAAVEEARQAAQAQQSDFKQLRDAILAAAFESFDTSENTETVTLGEVSRIEARIVNPTQLDYASLPHISAENIQSITGRLDDVRSAAEDGMESGKYLFDAGDVLYSKLRPYLRKAAITDFAGLCSADMYPIKIDSKRLTPEYLRALLVSEHFTAYANEASARSRMPKLNREQLFAFEFALPSIDQQQRVAAQLETQLTALAEAETAAQAQLREIELLPARLLAQAFEEL